MTYLYFYLSFTNNTTLTHNTLLQGGETDIHAKFYSLAFQQNYDEDDGTVSWKVVDYQFAGDIPYF